MVKQTTDVLRTKTIVEHLSNVKQTLQLIKTATMAHCLTNKWKRAYPPMWFAAGPGEFHLLTVNFNHQKIFSRLVQEVVLSSEVIRMIVKHILFVLKAT